MGGDGDDRDDRDDASSRGEDDASSFDAILQEIARAPSRQAPVAQLTDPDRIAHFRIEGRLGHGAMGIVYRARDTSLHRTVALKVLPGGFERDEGRRARFLREARAAAALNHPNLATVYEVGQADGQIYIAMEHVPGESLRELLASSRPTVDESLRIGRQIAAALAHAHAAGVIHRDLKPENVMVSQTGTIKVLDFGLAKLQQSGDGSGLETETEAGLVMGTPAYMAPEQWRGSRVTAAADVFAFGVIFYEMLTGNRPFTGEGRLALAHSIAADTPAAASSSNDAVGSEVDALVAACLVKTEAGRIADGSALEQRLAQLEGKRAPEVAKAPARTEGRIRRVGAFVLLATLTVAAALGATRLGSTAPSSAGASRVPTPAEAAPPAGPSARAGVITMVNAPPPISTNAEALRHYQIALADLRRASWTLGVDEITQAVALEPTLAAAHLRAALFDTSAAEFRATMQYSEFLDARDRALLHAVEPMVLEVPPNHDEAIRRLTALAQEHPNDAELLFYEGSVELEVDEATAMATLARVLVLDPAMASAEDQMGWAALKNSEDDLALDHFRRCVVISPGAVTCIRHIANLEANLGHCAAFTEAARQALVIEPDDYLSQLNWLSARLAGGVARGEADELVDEALSSTVVRHLGTGQRGWFVARRAVAYWFGDFGDALRLGYEGVDAGRTSEEPDLASRLAAFEEVGREHEAVPAVRLYLSLRATIGEQNDGVALRSLREQGEEAELRRLRDEWLRAPRQERRQWRKDVTPGRDWADWLKYYGAPALSAADAMEALKEREHFAPAPDDALGATENEELGRIYLLAGRPQEALVPLRHAAGACQPFLYQGGISLVGPMVRARYELGLAEEAVGDPAAACAAYASVLERWGEAKPRSKTADATRARVKALACPVAPVTPR